MAVKPALVWCALVFLVTVSIVQAGCPPLVGGYWTVHSQADADKLKSCHTLDGDLYITGYNASSPIILEGPIHVKGDLKLAFSIWTGPKVSYFSMKTLVSVGRELHVGGNWWEKGSASSNLTTLDFPALKSVGRWMWLTGPSFVETINFTSLERVGTMWMTNMESLRDLIVPKLKSVGILRLSRLPSLKTLSFEAGLEDMSWYFGCGLEIWNTSSISITGLNMPDTSKLEVTDNPYLTNLSFPFMTVLSDKWGHGHISIRGAPDFVLDLPKLRRIKRTIAISGLGTVNIPNLRYMDGNLETGASGQLDKCTNCRPTALTNFTAPKLLRVVGKIIIDSSSSLVDINLPVLRFVGDISINNTAAVDLPRGVWIPKLTHVHDVEILDTAPYCSYFDVQRCRGVIAGNYFWGTASQHIEDSVAQSCAEIWNGVGIVDRIRWWSERSLLECDGSLSVGCPFGSTLSVGFMIKAVPFLIGIAMIRYMMLRRRRFVQLDAARTKIEERMPLLQQEEVKSHCT